jgi:large subunit ribosomal protein L24
MPMHSKSKSIVGHLNEKLRKELGRRSIPLRKNDTVKIARGSFKGKAGKITSVNRKGMKIFVEKVIRKKSDGTEFEVAIDPSKVIVLEIDRSDRKRLKNKKEKSVKK